MNLGLSFFGLSGCEGVNILQTLDAIGIEIARICSFYTKSWAFWKDLDDDWGGAIWLFRIEEKQAIKS